MDHWLEAVEFFTTPVLAASTAEPGFRFLGGFSRLLSMVFTVALASFPATSTTAKFLERAASEEGLDVEGF